MKKLIFPTLIILAFYAHAEQVKERHPYRVIRTLTADLNNDNRSDTIRLISDLEGRNDFNKVSISLAGYGKSVFKARDYWTVVDSEFLVKNKNAIHTKLLFAKKTDKHAVILLFGQIDGAGYRGEFSIVNIENNKAKLVFEETDGKGNEPDVEWARELTDLEHNGRLCFVFSEMGELYGTPPVPNADLGTYHPYYVYKITDTCQLDKPLTRAYNEKNYVFAGYRYSEKIKVLYPRNGGKPRIWKK